MTSNFSCDAGWHGPFIDVCVCLVEPTIPSSEPPHKGASHPKNKHPPWNGRSYITGNALDISRIWSIQQNNIDITKTLTVLIQCQQKMQKWDDTHFRNMGLKLDWHGNPLFFIYLNTKCLWCLFGTSASNAPPKTTPCYLLHYSNFALPKMFASISFNNN